MHDPNQWAYVWASYGLSAAVLLGYWISLRVRRAAAERMLTGNASSHGAYAGGEER